MVFPFVELHEVPVVPFPVFLPFPLGGSASASLSTTPPALYHLQASQSSEELAPIFFLAMPGKN